MGVKFAASFPGVRYSKGGGMKKAGLYPRGVTNKARNLAIMQSSGPRPQLTMLLKR